jgi:hypothetical protein
MGAQNKPAQIIDTSCTASGMYQNQYQDSSLQLTGVRTAGQFRVFFSSAKSGDFLTAAYFSIYTTETTNNIPKKYRRIKVGNSSANVESNPPGINMSTAYLYYTNTGNIIFAGKSTRYYGMSNIDGTMAQPGWTAPTH